MSFRTHVRNPFTEFVIQTLSESKGKDPYVVILASRQSGPNVVTSLPAQAGHHSLCSGFEMTIKEYMARTKKVFLVMRRIPNPATTQLI